MWTECLTLDVVQRCAVVNMVMNVLIPYKTGMGVGILDQHFVKKFYVHCRHVYNVGIGKNVFFRLSLKF